MKAIIGVNFNICFLYYNYELCDYTAYLKYMEMISEKIQERGERSGQSMWLVWEKSRGDNYIKMILFIKLVDEQTLFDYFIFCPVWKIIF